MSVSDKISVGVPEQNEQDLSEIFSELCWVAYSPSSFDPTQNPIVWPSVEDIREDFRALRSVGFAGLVTYGAYSADPSNPNQGVDISGLAQEAGFNGMIVGVWDPTDERELQAAEEASRHPVVVGYSVGNEGLGIRYDFETLLRAMNRLRRTTGKPVTTTEEFGDYYEVPDLAEAGDWIFPNVHPYFSELRHHQVAAEWTEEIFDDFQKEFDSLIIFKEVGLPSDGDLGLSEENQSLYYQFLQATDVAYVVFEAFDSPWKGISFPENSPESFPNPEPHWGVFTQNREPKVVASTICND
ncbi:MAG: hypothetical protein F6K42_05250 [Leptolyngbya sp. SIO1D8]|nr:hypothetical protein [Leptolyngbya sp. SIO1D8]